MPYRPPFVEVPPPEPRAHELALEVYWVVFEKKAHFLQELGPMPIALRDPRLKQRANKTKERVDAARAHVAALINACAAGKETP